MNKEIYFYNRKYPEHEIIKIIVNDEELIISKDYKRISGIYTNYDISCLMPSENEYYISLYNPYEDEEILIHENTFHNELVFCYNFDLINEWRNEDIKLEIHKLEKKLKELKGSDINEYRSNK